MQNTDIADLHGHSYYSDGLHSPEDIAKMAFEAGLKVYALTDHDTIKGHTRMADACKKHGIIFIPGVEMTLHIEEPTYTGALHYLVYIPLDLQNNTVFIQEFNDLLTLSNFNINKLIVNKINQLFGIEGSLEKLLPKNMTIEDICRHSVGSISYMHYILWLKEQNAPDGTYLKIAQQVGPHKMPAGIPIKQFGLFLKKWPTLLRSLAHPGAGSSTDVGYAISAPKYDILLGLFPFIMQTVGLDAIEVYHPINTQLQRNQLLDLAKSNNLLITAGSDFHTTKKSSVGQVRLDQNNTNAFLKRLGYPKIQ